MKIAVAGLGYVGMSNACLLAQNHEVVAFDISIDRVNLVNQKKSPIQDNYIEDYLKNKNLNLRATSNYEEAFKDAKFVIVSTPTNYDTIRNTFDTSSVENVIENILKIEPQATIIIKSTIPVGYTAEIREKYNVQNIIFSPEFLREGNALYDNLYPSRIIVGDHTENAQLYGKIMLEAALRKNTPLLFTGSTEAEAIKLFSNTYLAMRVAFFNELDSYAEIRNLNSKQIIDGVGLDPRIGTHYNNPSFC
jgi:UDPglucose 6-dehydrogenase